MNVSWLLMFCTLGNLKPLIPTLMAGLGASSRLRYKFIRNQARRLRTWGTILGLCDQHLGDEA